MMTPDELDDFLSGKLGDVLVFSYKTSEMNVRFERRSMDSVQARVPEAGDRSRDPFNIEAALANPRCDVSFTLSEGEYAIEISKRFQVRSVMKIAFNHLNWHNEDFVQHRYTNDKDSGAD